MMFYKLEPWGFEVDERRFGMLGWAILKTMGGWNGKPEQFTIKPPETAAPESGIQKLKRLLGFDPEKAKAAKAGPRPG